MDIQKRYHIAKIKFAYREWKEANKREGLSYFMSSPDVFTLDVAHALRNKTVQAQLRAAMDNRKTRIHSQASSLNYHRMQTDWNSHLSGWFFIV